MTKNFKFSSILMLGVFMIVGSIPSWSQVDAQEDRKGIEKTLGMYFDGWLTGDTTLIGEAMHSTCHLKNIKEGKVAVYDRSTYLGFFKPRPRIKNAEGRIIDINITGPAAAAKIELETEKRIFTDYFNLLRLDGRWYIMDKISTFVQK